MTSHANPIHTALIDSDAHAPGGTVRFDGTVTG